MDKLPTSSMPVEGVNIDSNSNVKTVGKSNKGSVGRWSDVEKKSYLEGLRKYGEGNWERISKEYVPTKIAKQIHRRYLRYAKKNETTQTTESNEQGWVLALPVPEIQLKKHTTITEDKIPVPETKGKHKAHVSGSSRVTKEPISRSKPMKPSNSNPFVAFSNQMNCSSDSNQFPKVPEAQNYLSGDTKGHQEAKASGSSRITKEPLLRSEPIDPSNLNLSVPFLNKWKSSDDNNMFPEVKIICSGGHILEEDPSIKNKLNNVLSSMKQDLDPDQLNYVQDSIVLPTDEPVCFGESLENQSTVGDGVTSGIQVLNELRNMGAYHNSEVRLGQEVNYDSWPHGDEFKIL